MTALTMPYRWTHQDITSQDQPMARLVLWPHQSMTGKGFATFIAITAAMLSLPLIALLGSPITWVLMLFFLAAIWAIWFALMKNRQHLSLHEELAIWPDRVQLDHVQPRRKPLTWEANPYWVSTHLAPKGRVENYLTLKGNGREVELGAFLSPEERIDLREELDTALARARSQTS
ncbi:MAG: DUF2244 domain-containing protein [Pseudomonadota bacterium]